MGIGTPKRCSGWGVDRSAHVPSPASSWAAVAALVTKVRTVCRRPGDRLTSSFTANDARSASGSCIATAASGPESTPKPLKSVGASRQRASLAPDFAAPPAGPGDFTGDFTGDSSGCSTPATPSHSSSTPPPAERPEERNASDHGIRKNRRNRVEWAVPSVAAMMTAALPKSMTALGECGSGEPGYCSQMSNLMYTRSPKAGRPRWSGVG